MMILFDAMFLTFSCLSLAIILTYIKIDTRLHIIKKQLTAVFLLQAVYSLLLFLQWSNAISVSLEKLEDLTGVLIPISWLFLFYMYKHNMDKLQIKNNEERLSLALTSAKCGIWDWNLKTGEIFFDSNYFRIAGYEPNEFPNSYESWKARVHPDDIEGTEAKVKKYLTKQLNEYVVEFRFKTKVGKWMWIQGWGRVSEYDKIGEAVRFIGIHIDITERKEAELKIKARELFLDSVVENIPDMIFVKDAAELKFVQLNKAGETLLGYTKDKFIGKSDYDFFPKEEADFFVKNDMEVLRTGKLVEIPEERIQTKHLGERILKTKKIPIPDDVGRPKYLLGISEDITEYKKLVEQLRQAQKMEAIGTLAGGIAHDFNNILTSIIGYSELLKEDLKGNERSTKFLGRVLIGGNRAKKLVSQILLFSRQSENELTQIKVIPLVKEVVTMLKASLPSTIMIKLNTLAASDFILADPTQIHQILMNLCTNSAHAMRKNGGILSIEIDQKEIGKDDKPSFPNQKPGSYLKIMISDTGHGIPSDVIAKIFDPFFSTKPRGEGTGLGLSVVHGIVKDCGGDIKVYSEEDQGATFSIFLPLIDEGKQQDVKEIELVQRGEEHLLFVDDEEHLADLGKLMLERLGYKVTAVSDSQSAWQIFQNNPDAFDMIITDRTMPGLTGLELSKKAQALCPKIPIILCTGFSTDYSLEQLREIGIRGCIYKPVLKKELAEIIRHVLDYEGLGSEDRG
jgi:PAS domain S-box-containing protein